MKRHVTLHDMLYFYPHINPVDFTRCPPGRSAQSTRCPRSRSWTCWRTCRRPSGYVDLVLHCATVLLPSSTLCNSECTVGKLKIFRPVLFVEGLLYFYYPYWQTLCRGWARAWKNIILASWLDIVISPWERFRSRILLTRSISTIERYLSKQILLYNGSPTWLFKSGNEEMVFIK